MRLMQREVVCVGRGLRVAGEGATVTADIVCSYTTGNGEERELERRERVEMRLGDAVEPLSLMLEETLVGMRVGEVCRLGPLAREMASPSPDLPADISLTYTLTLLSLSRGRQLWERSPTEALLMARQLKERGGQLFQKGREREAAVCYSRAAKLATAASAGRGAESEERLQVVLWLNLAACQLRMGLDCHALSNCSRVLAVVPGSVKALYRRAVAAMRLGDLDQAQQDLRQAEGVEPGNLAVQRKLRELVQLRQRQSATLSHALRPLFHSQT